MAATMQSLTIAAAVGFAIGTAWLWPGSVAASILGWLSTLLVVVLAQRNVRPYWAIYLCGLITNAIGFYWLNYTISVFGGFGWLPTLLLFLAFLGISSLQFVLFLFLYRNTPIKLRNWGLAAPMSWVTAEIFAIRIFPWQMGHTQLGFEALAQTAALGGTLLISFIMFWCAEALVRHKSNHSWLQLLPAVTNLIAVILYGCTGITKINETLTRSPKIPVALIQANTSIETKGSISHFTKNIQRHLKLTQQTIANEPSSLIVWPESVIQNWVSAKLTSSDQDSRLNDLKTSAPLITGAMTYESPTKLYNSTLAILPSGKIEPPYHKQILMPFGEYMPLAQYFPQLYQLLPAEGGLTPGQDTAIFKLPDPLNPTQMVNVTPLICYEDVIPDLANKATAQGAELLVNLTNDAWFGNSAAPWQHHAIASFRAIETRRFLLRSTNSGLTAIVNPLGQTINQLPVFSEGILRGEVYALTGVTTFTRLGGNRPWMIFCIIYACLILVIRVKYRHEP